MTNSNVLDSDVKKRNALAASIGANLFIDENECRNVLKFNAKISYVTEKNSVKLKAIDGFLTSFGYQLIAGRKINITSKGWSALACKS